MQPSPIYRTICEFFRLTDIQASGWRQALSEATWSEARAWAQEVQAFDLSPPHGLDKLAQVVPFLQHISTPSRVVAVIEGLVQEGLLTRREGSVLEEKMLACVNAQGQWFWDI